MSSDALLRYRLIKQSALFTGWTFAEIARRLHVTPAMITHVAKGRRRSKRVERALARACGMKHKELFK